MKTASYKLTNGNREMKMRVSLNDTNRMEVAFTAEEKLSGEIVLKFGKRLTNINAEAVRDVLEADSYEHMMERIKELFFGTAFAYELFVEFLRSRQIVPDEAI